MIEYIEHIILVLVALVCFAIGMYSAHKLGVHPCLNRIRQLETALKIHNIPLPLHIEGN